MDGVEIAISLTLTLPVCAKSLRDVTTSGTGNPLTRVERDKLLELWHDREFQLLGGSFDPPVSGWVTGVSRLITAPQEFRRAFSRWLGRTER